jgi:uncharacterized protein YbdZ (MbtH family)
MIDNNDESRIYEVVRNHEEQYSIWLAETNPPEGWRKAGKRGSKDECRAFIIGSVDGHEALEPPEAVICE